MMEINRQIEKILALQTPQEKVRQLEWLNELLEYSDQSFDQKELAEGLQLLLGAALQEGNEEAKERFFHTIDTAVSCHEIAERVNWDAMASVLATFPAQMLSYALTILGLSGQERYLPIVELYVHHSDPQVRRDARDAIEEIQHRCAC